MQANVYDPVYRHFRRANPHMVEPSVYDVNGRTEVITFPVEGPVFGVYRDGAWLFTASLGYHLVTWSTDSRRR